MFGMTTGELFRFIFFDWWLFLLNCIVKAVEHPHLLFLFALKVAIVVAVIAMIIAGIFVIRLTIMARRTNKEQKK